MAHRKEGCVEVEAETAVVLPPDEDHLGPPRAGRGKNSPPSAGAWLHQHLDFGLLTSRTVREYGLPCSATYFVALRCGSHSKLSSSLFNTLEGSKQMFVVELQAYSVHHSPASMDSYMYFSLKCFLFNINPFALVIYPG